jgi:hypothetical protein
MNIWTKITTFCFKRCVTTILTMPPVEAVLPTLRRWLAEERTTTEPMGTSNFIMEQLADLYQQRIHLDRVSSLPESHNQKGPSLIVLSPTVH